MKPVFRVESANEEIIRDPPRALHQTRQGPECWSKDD
jgi:hypothetical protein